MRHLALIALFVMAACGSDEEPHPPVSDWFPSDVTTAWTLVRDCRFSIEHDGASIEVYASPDAAAAYAAGAFPLAAGATLVKVEHDDGTCESVGRYTAMKKLPDGTWSWQRTGAERVMDSTASVARCVGCHALCTDGRDLTCTDP